MKTTLCNLLAILVAILLPVAGSAQVNSGSDGHDGALNPTSKSVRSVAVG